MTTKPSYLLVLISIILSSCEGTFDWVYDKPVAISSAQGQFYLDASSWKTWYYIDIPAISDSTKIDSTYDASKSIVSYDIPLSATGDRQTTTGHQLTGQYMYWFDVFGEGLTKNEFRYFTPTSEQEAPEKWTIAIHRNNVRTNNCGVYETSLTSFDNLPKDFSSLSFTEDEWTENAVWDDNAQMLNSLVPSQGIKINTLLSSWLIMSIPPIPPSFAHNNHIFILRLQDSTYAALQLVDYLSPTGTKCCLTIKYKYPL